MKIEKKKQQTKITLNNIIKNNGATLNHKGQKIQYKKGFQVSYQDLYIIPINQIDIILKKVNNTLKTLNKGEHLGLWVDNNQMYIDKSKKINNLTEAVNFGKSKNQLSIFDWKNKTCISLGGL